MLPTALAVMARYPTIGVVKTRLATAISAERASALYRAFLLDLEARFHTGPRTLVWAFFPAESDFASLVKPGAHCLPQRGENLGQRMRNCFAALLHGGFEQVLMIGVDVPHVRNEWLDEAEDALARNDIVLGPTADGGYYLVAMHEPHDVFTGVPMSTGETATQTIRKAEAAGLRVHLLPRSFDIDERHDLARLRALLKQSDTALRLPHTAALLQGWGQESDN